MIFGYKNGKILNSYKCKGIDQTWTSYFYDNFAHIHTQK